ncbi:hypothetical protein V6N13_001051 [Hibiscus sabdariffa]|uniref:Yippee domain-containing protein n=1 Tax=Hibiscus sabdariffa TaxID=183260 RepID=A0ABR2G763_9ROSI
MEFYKLFISQVFFPCNISTQAAPANSNLFREYIDYDSSGSPFPTNGKFNVFWNSDNLGPSQIDGEVQGLLCDSHYNVKTNDTIHRFIYELPINNVHCNDCNRHIGVKFISAADNDPPRPYPLEGKVLFYCGRVLFWDGNSFLRTESGEPVMRLIFFDGTQLRYTGPCPDEETDEETGKEDSQ